MNIFSCSDDHYKTLKKIICPAFSYSLFEKKNYICFKLFVVRSVFYLFI